jgi:hypothetical protein
LGGVDQKIARKQKTNQGIRLSAKYAVVTFVAGSLAFAPAFVLLLGVEWFEGIRLGFLIGLWFGGLDVLFHYTLRLVLFATGDTPRRFVSFLAHCVRLIFMRQVGGGFIFIHRMLLEHFASLEMPKAKTG